MNAQQQAPASAGAAVAAGAAVDERNPWLGLASFSEDTRQYFYGREEEVAELARRVQRKLLTVLFGQSGLGKTSILRAGLVPRLRAQGYCPVYVRIDYGRDAPEPAEQIKQAIANAAQSSGQWSQVGVAVAGESLWEFLHHRDDVLRDAAGATLTPLLIFDQFEEIFTLAQSDDFGRQRAARFIADLADLVENRAPKALEARLEEDENAGERFDFARSDYRVVIALREDYLAPLEGLKNAMPSITLNRLRLAPMTGQQALAAVVGPGKGLVTEEVAAAIVRFVAGGGEIAHAEVEPSLLSLICRELNDARIAQGRGEISLDLLAGSHATILSNFYERSLADQPPAVRRVIEEQLLTASGFRENIAEERVLSAFAAAGAGPDTLAVLVNRRLLRIEERLDVRRVELTHDVLCGVVKASRDARHQREAREATEQLLAQQRERELAARRALVRARQVATVCGVLALGAIAAAVLAFLSTQRARRAEHEAQQTRAVSEQAREQAESLLGYLTTDFSDKLETFGRLDVAGEFAKRQIDYFHALPPALKDPQTVRNGALAMVYYAKAMRALGNLKGGGAAADEAVQLLQQLRDGGDTSEPTVIALAQGMAARAAILDNRNDPTGLQVGEAAYKLLQPVAEKAGASAPVRRAYAEILIRLGFEQTDAQNASAAVETLQHARQLTIELGANDPANLEMNALYSEDAAWLDEALVKLGRPEEARKIGEDAFERTQKVLALRPGYRLALHAQQVLTSEMGAIASDDLDPAGKLKWAERSMQTSDNMLQLDPHNVITWNNLGVAHIDAGSACWDAGRIREAVQYYLKSAQDEAHASSGGSWFVLLRTFFTAGATVSQAQAGDVSGAAAALAAAEPERSKLEQTEPAGSIVPVLSHATAVGYGEAGIALERGDAAQASRLARQQVDRLQAVKTQPSQDFQKYILLYRVYGTAGEADYALGNYDAMERAFGAALEAHQKSPNQSIGSRREEAMTSTWHALALLRLGRAADARQSIDPVLKFERELAAHNHGDRWLPVELAAALYVHALIEPKARAAELREAAALLDGVTPEMRSMRMVRQWRTAVRSAG